jgi:MarR family transcriptional regulator for hemolysin
MSVSKSEHRQLKNPAMGWLLGRVFRLWRSAISQSVKPMGMTEARWSVMMKLRMLGEGSSQHTLAMELGIELPSLNRTVNQLAELNLVERRAHPSDRRCKCLWFTQEGKKQLESLEEVVGAVRTGLTEGISDDELDGLFNVLKKIESNACALLDNATEGGEHDGA